MIDKIFNFFLIPFVGSMSRVELYRLFFYVEWVFSFWIWGWIMISLNFFSVEILPEESFLIFFCSVLFSWFFFTGAKPNTEKDIATIKREIHFTTKQFYFNLIVIVGISSFLVRRIFF